ncbi:MAG: hypothetical protein GY856_04260 [bacterium]|nr:hypothetical protein [bacterium]
MLYILGNALALLVLAVVVWLTGRLLERWLPPASDLGAWRPLARLCLGLTFWTALAFALAAGGLLTRSSVAGMAGLVLLASIGTSFGRWRPAAPESGAAARRPAPADLVCAAVFVALLTPSFLLAISPPVSWDASTYHLTLPKLFIANQGFRPVAFNVYSNWPLNAELLFAVAMLVKSYILAKLVHFGFGLLTLYAIFLGCRHHDRSAGAWPVGWMAMAFFLANGVVAFELRVAYVDLAYAFFFLAAFLFMLRAVDEGPPARALLLVSGICCGLMAGIKLTGVVGAAVIGTLYLPRLLQAARARALGGEARRFALRFVLPILLLSLPWILKAAWYTGNPVYPLLHEWFGGPDWSSTLTAQLGAWHASIGMGRTLGDYLLLPLRVILCGAHGYDHFDGALGRFWIVLLPLVLGFGLDRALVRRCLGTAGLYFVVWSLTSQQMRFLIPILPLVAIATAVTLAEIWERLPSKHGRMAARWFCLVVAVGLVAGIHGRIISGGYRTAGIYLRAEGELTATVVPPVTAFINERLPPDARLLLLNTNAGFFCDREYIADSFFEASQIAEWLRPAATVAELRRRLAERGITHLLVENKDWSIAWPESLDRLLRDPQQIEVLFRSENGRFTLLRLRREGIDPLS